MAIISVKDFSFTYPGNIRALQDLTFTVQPGEFVVLCGGTGSGKSTLLRCLKKELFPQGVSQGTAQVSAQRVGLVTQNPENGIVMDSVWHELAFGLENMGVDPVVIRKRIAETANFFGVDAWLDKRIFTLSGGQKQLLNLMGVMIMQPQILLLDEPTAQLDPISAKELISVTERICRELGTTVILSEHRLEDALPAADRVIYMTDGRAAFFDDAEQFVKALYRSGDPFTEALPASARIAARLKKEIFPLTVRQGRTLFENEPLPRIRSPQPVQNSEEVLCAKQIWFRYDKKDDYIIKGLDFTLKKGVIHALTGGNGSGKSTLLRLLCGAIKPQSGKVRAKQTVGLLVQDPRSVFVKATVADDLAEFGHEFGYTVQNVQRLAARLGLSEVLNRHPYDLSGGQQQKAAIAKLLLLNKQILLLDEPAKGLDATAKKELSDLLRELAAEGRSVVLVSHDLEFIARTATTCSMLSGGVIAASEQTHRFFDFNLFYTTAANRITRDRVRGCIVPEDIIPQ